jgi:microcystin-dependent protein
VKQHKHLVTEIAEVIAAHQEQKRSREQDALTEELRGNWSRVVSWLLPNGGSILLVLLLIVTQSVWARPLQNTAANSVTTISYQGRLADADGEPLTGVYNMEFRIYAHPTAGEPLWSEYWTGGNAIQVSDGLFNVMLGSIETGLVAAIQDHEELYLGITIDTDSEMLPRIQLGSVPYSMHALTVPDGSITQEKLAPGLNLVPPGTIVMWSGSTSTIPDGWALCDGSNGTPDLRDRFIVGAGSTYAVGDTGGATSVELSTNQIPAHTHAGSTGAAGAHTHSASSSRYDGPEYSQSSSHGGGVYYGMGTIQYKDNKRLGGHSHDITVDSVGNHTHSVSIGSTGGGQAHENRPPYYSLAMIIKLP